MTGKKKTDNSFIGVRWPAFYAVLTAILLALVLSTVLWVKSYRSASDSTVNDLVKFYLQEIAERNATSIASELQNKAEQVANALTVLSPEFLEDEAAIREYLYLVQKINGLDLFALVDENGMVYTAESSFSGISRFGFLSERSSETQIHLVEGYGTKSMVLISLPVSLDFTPRIKAVSCFTGVNLENIVSVMRLQNTENKSYCRLFNIDGVNQVEISGDFPNEQNLFDVWERVAQFSGEYSLEKVRKDWQEGREGYAIYSNQNTGDSYVYYKPVPQTDLVLTVLMRESNINEVVEHGTARMLRSSVIYLSVAATALLVVCLLVGEVLRKAVQKQHENEQFQIVSALSNDYIDVFVTEPLRDYLYPIKKQGKMLSESGKRRRSYRESWKSYTDRFVLREDGEELLRAISAKNICASMKTKREFSRDFRVRLEDGVHHCQVKYVAVPGSDGQFVVGLRNIDEQVQSEQERQKVLQDALASAQHANRAKTTFLNNMSHDIRTPMNAIIGYTSLAATHVDKPEQVRDYLAKIQTASSHLMSLINDVLDMSRIEAGKVKIEEKQLHLPDLIHDLRTIVQTDICSKQLEFYIDTVDVRNEDIICDRLRLNQILLNLLSNAMKFTKPGGMVSLRIIQTQNAPRGYAGYEFRVKDTGIGISREFQKHIFEAFSREQTSTVSGIQGTGLGMAITKSIVDIMGGTISVQSEVGKGTEFTVRLQFRISGEAVKYESIPSLQGLRALVADDDANTCMGVSSMLGVIGMRSEWTTSGKEAVLRAQFAIDQGDEFHAYIIDWLMPDMNGIEVVRRIRRIIGDSKPIIILTAYDWSGIEDEARQAGVTGFCSKPLFMSELREALTESYPVHRQIPTTLDSKADFMGRKLLVVEDNPLNQEIATEILTGMGFEVSLASDGEEAVEIMKSAKPGQFDLILMDIQMPHMNGYEATRQIRKLPNSGVSSIPIVAMTANAFEEDRTEALSAGMSGYIAKPIEIAKLARTLSSFFD